jgi:hypothetical protein
VLTIPTTDVASQTIFTQLNNQNCQLNLYQKRTGFFLDLYLAPTQLVIGGVLCRNQCFLILNSYLGFIGEFMWADTQGNMDPTVGWGIGTRFTLNYLLPSDIPATALYGGLESTEQNPAPGYPS